MDIPFPPGPFELIYADPPWHHEASTTPNRIAGNHYPTLTTAQICDLPVWNLAAKHAMLFLWSTSPKLAEAMEVVSSWDFVYRTCAVWVKPSIGLGSYFRSRHELLLVARRGTFKTPLPANRPDSVITASRLKHSAKPEQVYEHLERMYPSASKIELFARGRREGWSSWGDGLP